MDAAAVLGLADAGGLPGIQEGSVPGARARVGRGPREAGRCGKWRRRLWAFGRVLTAGLCLRADDEMFSDIYKIREVADGLCLEVEGKVSE